MVTDDLEVEAASNTIATAVEKMISPK